MAFTKAMLVFFLGALVLCSHMVSISYADGDGDANKNTDGTISYGALKKNWHPPNTAKGHQEANPYHRGCEPAAGCRTGKDEDANNAYAGDYGGSVGAPNATATVAATSASAISSSSSVTTNFKVTSDGNKKRDNLSACSDKFVPRFDGLRFIETLVTAHR